jgi:hypothetical protein
MTAALIVLGVVMLGMVAGIVFLAARKNDLDSHGPEFAILLIAVLVITVLAFAALAGGME